MPSDERRHETTVGGVTAWAGPWRAAHDDGDQRCVIYEDGSWQETVRLEFGGYIWVDNNCSGPVTTVVLAAVLQEAAAKAQSMDVESIQNDGGAADVQ